MLFVQSNGNGIGPNLEWNERFSLKNSSIYALFIYNFIKSTRQSFCIPSDFGKKLHPLSLSRQKNCTPSGFHGKKIAHSLAANLSEIAI